MVPLRVLAFVAASALALGCEPEPEPYVPGVAVNGTCAPHGERFLDHYTCDDVKGPSPTDQSDEPATIKVIMPDPARLDDPDLEWMEAELVACSCVCCHHDTGIGAYRWSYEFEPTFIDSVGNDVLQRFTDPPPPHAAQIPPEENNGFARGEFGFPTTDKKRFQAFIDRELERRGLAN